MVYVEPTFPRGTNLEIEDNKPKKKFVRKTNYGATSTHEEKPHKPTRREREKIRTETTEHAKEDFEDHIQAAPLSLKTVQEGLLVMACVFKVNQMQITLSLPGKISGQVPITAISQAYSKRLQGIVDNPDSEMQCPSLEQLYETGDVVYVKVMKKDEKSPILGLSLSPVDLHSHMNHASLVEGLVICAAIEDVEDHGYIMETGIKNVRAFLPTENIKKKNPEVGENIFCLVEKVTQTATTSTVILKALKSKNPRRLKVEEDRINIDTIMPGTNVQFTVTKILKMGLQGTILDDNFTAYVNVHHLMKPLSNPEDISLFKIIEGRILYVLPLTKHVYVTLQQIDSNKIALDTSVEVGSVVDDAKCVLRSSGGILFRLNKSLRGYMPKTYLKTKLKDNFDEEIVLSKYQPNSVHSVRILKYEMFDRTFLCNDDEHLIEVDYFKATDLKLGALYDCIVKRPIPSGKGYFVEIGKVKGALGANNIDKSRHYNVNDIVKIRVTDIDEEKDNVQVTNRKEYLETPSGILSIREKVMIGKKYLGTVSRDNDNSFLISFFNKIVGIVFKNENYVIDKKVAKLKLGEIAEFVVLENVAEHPIKLTMEGDEECLGKIGTAVVTGIYPLGVDVKLKKSHKKGIVPPNYFSDFKSLNLPLFNSIKEGEELPVVAIRDKVFSVRDVEYFKRYWKTEYKRVAPGNILKAYVLKQVKHKIHLKLSLKDYPETVKLNLEDICENAGEVQMEEGQVMFVKVLDCAVDKKLLNVSAKLQDVCIMGPHMAANYLGRYFYVLNGLQMRLQKSNVKIASFKIAQPVTGIIENFIEQSNQMVIKINSDNDEDEQIVYGIATKDHSQEYAVGDEVKGKIVWVDFEKKLLNVCIKKKQMKYILDGEPVQFDMMSKKYDFVPVFSNQQVNVGYLKDLKSPLVYVPASYHYNHLNPNILSGSTEVYVVKSVYGKTIALDVSTFNLLKGWKVYLENYKNGEKKEELKSRVIPTRSKGPVKECWLPEFKEGESEPIVELYDDYYSDASGDSEAENEEDNSDEDDEENDKTFKLDAEEEMELDEKEEAKPDKKDKKKRNKIKEKIGKTLELKKNIFKMKVKKGKNHIPQLDGLNDDFDFEADWQDIFIPQFDGAADTKLKKKKHIENESSVEVAAVVGKKKKKMEVVEEESKVVQPEKEKKKKKMLKKEEVVENIEEIVTEKKKKKDKKAELENVVVEKNVVEKKKKKKDKITESEEKVVEEKPVEKNVVEKKKKKKDKITENEEENPVEKKKTKKELKLEKKAASKLLREKTEAKKLALSKKSLQRKEFHRKQMAKLSDEVRKEILRKRRERKRLRKQQNEEGQEPVPKTVATPIKKKKRSILSKLSEEKRNEIKKRRKEKSKLRKKMSKQKKFAENGKKNPENVEAETKKKKKMKKQENNEETAVKLAQNVKKNLGNASKNVEKETKKKKKINKNENSEDNAVKLVLNAKKNASEIVKVETKKKLKKRENNEEIVVEPKKKKKKNIPQLDGADDDFMAELNDLFKHQLDGAVDLSNKKSKSVKKLENGNSLVSKKKKSFETNKKEKKVKKAVENGNEKVKKVDDKKKIKKAAKNGIKKKIKKVDENDSKTIKAKALKKKEMKKKKLAELSEKVRNEIKRKRKERQKHKKKELKQKGSHPEATALIVTPSKKKVKLSKLSEEVKNEIKKKKKERLKLKKQMMRQLRAEAKNRKKGKKESGASKSEKKKNEKLQENAEEVDVQTNLETGGDLKAKKKEKQAKKAKITTEQNGGEEHDVETKSEKKVDKNIKKLEKKSESKEILVAKIDLKSNKKANKNKEQPEKKIVAQIEEKIDEISVKAQKIGEKGGKKAKQTTVEDILIQNDENVNIKNIQKDKKQKKNNLEKSNYEKIFKNEKIINDVQENGPSKNSKKKDQKKEKAEIVEVISVVEATMSKKEKKNKKKEVIAIPQKPTNLRTEEISKTISKKEKKKMEKSVEVAKIEVKKARKEKRKLTIEKEDEEEIKPKKQALDIQLPGADDFWNLSSKHEKLDSSSSSDDEAEVVVRKKKLTPNERFEAIKAEEKRVREIEEELADASTNPHTPDQFERLVIANPNSSLLWIKYMIFHMESAELDKARSVAQKAFKTINFREQDERLNVWVALLNLEIRYGTTETYKEVLKEALQLNDAFKVYSKTIHILIDCKKVQEVHEMIGVLLKKFKPLSEMWELTATAYYEIGAADKAKELLNRALKSLRNDQHIPLIVKFAFLHNNYGEKDDAHILFEQILTSYPKRTDIWAQYVDMLAKDNRIDIARQTLDRAIAQKLPMRKMKTLYTKYVQFEEKFGDKDAVRKVKQMAAEYVKNQTNRGDDDE